MFREEQMVTVKTLADFVKYNDKDLTRIIYKCFPKSKWKNYEMEDVKQDCLYRFARVNTVERWDPEKAACFSTYMFRCIHNFIHSYYLNDSSREHVVHNSISLDRDRGEEGNPVDLHHYLEGTNYNSISDLGLHLSGIHKLLVEHDKIDIPRSIKLSSLLEKICEGKKDQEIADEIGITCAGIGGAKRTLLKFIRKCEDGTILKRIELKKDNTYERKRKRKRAVKHDRSVDPIGKIELVRREDCFQRDNESSCSAA